MTTEMIDGEEQRIIITDKVVYGSIVDLHVLLAFHIFFICYDCFDRNYVKGAIDAHILAQCK